MPFSTFASSMDLSPFGVTLKILWSSCSRAGAHRTPLQCHQARWAEVRTIMRTCDADHCRLRRFWFIVESRGEPWEASRLSMKSS